MKKQLIECVPNFSEGRNPEIIKQITDAIEGVEGITLLDVDRHKPHCRYFCRRTRSGT